MKQTEIGLIPDDWEVKRLGDIYNFQYGDGNTNPNNNGAFPVYGANGIIGGYTKFNAVDSIVIGHMGEYAGSVIWGSGKHFVTYNGTITKPKDEKILNPKYGYYSLLFRNINKICAGSGYPFLAYDKLNLISIPLPPLPEQQRIAKALSDVDALISTTEKLLKKKKNIKQGAMQNLLTGKKRLPGFAKSTNYKQTELGPIPEDWEVKSLGDIAFVTKLAGFEFTAHVNYSEIGKIIALRGLNVKNGYLVLDDVKFIDNSNFSKLDRSKLYINDLLFTYVGTVGNVALVNKNDTYYLAPNVALIRGNKYVYSYFLMYLMLSQHFFDNQIQALMSTTSQAALSMTNIRLFKIPLPSIEEQTAIANVLSSMDKEIETLNTKLEKYRNLKTAMMQQLLTGKIRL